MTLSALCKTNTKIKALAAAIAITAAILLPQLFHAVGSISGLGAAPGRAFLPMQLPVFLAGFAAGPIAGLAAGLLSPVISFAISGMPTAAQLPIMMVELAAYGLSAGLLSGVRLPSVIKLLAAQLSGRIVSAGAVLTGIYLLGNTSLTAAQIWNTAAAGLPGILLQLAVIPLILYRLDGVKVEKRHD